MKIVDASETIVDASEIPVPVTDSEVTLEWVARALSSQAEGVIVDGLEIEEVIRGTGTKFKLGLQYARNDQSLPSIMWLKAGFESPHQAALLSMASYYQEAIFYSQVLPHLDIRAPRCFFAVADSRTGHGVVLLENLERADIRFGSCRVPYSVEIVRNGLMELARMHALWWNSEELVARGFLQPLGPGTPIERNFKRFDLDHLQPFFDGEVGAALPSSLRDPNKLLRAFWAVQPHLLEGELCLTHGDAHIGNTYVEGEDHVGFLDWSAFKRAPWAFDVSYFIGCCLSVQDRRAHEKELLTFYLDELARLCVSAPQFDDAWLTYRRVMIYSLFIWLRNPTSMQPVENNVAVVSRLGLAVEDLETIAALLA